MANAYYNVTIKKRVLKSLIKLPRGISQRLNKLVKDLRDKGPNLSEWPNFSKFGKNKYHCHLNYRWVAVWEYSKSEIIIEVTYVGSRENAPY